MLNIYGGRLLFSIQEYRHTVGKPHYTGYLGTEYAMNRARALRGVDLLGFFF